MTTPDTRDAEAEAWRDEVAALAVDAHRGDALRALQRGQLGLDDLPTWSALWWASFGQPADHADLTAALDRARRTAAAILAEVRAEEAP